MTLSQQLYDQLNQLDLKKRGDQKLITSREKYYF